MIIVDRELEEARRGDPVGVALFGAGFMGRGIAERVEATRGMRLVGVYRRGRDVGEFCAAPGTDVVVEATGSVEFGARVALAAMAAGKHLVTASSELDCTLGPVLRLRASRAGVTMSGIDGDQPGVLMNLYRFVRGVGGRPLLCGNIKSFYDRYRDPTTQAGFAEKWGQSPRMITSFTDGTKMSMEQAVVANATGMGVWRRGMLGPRVPAGTHVRDVLDRYPLEELSRCRVGIVDYVVGAEPAPGVFVVAEHRDPSHRKSLEYYKMGPGPFYCYYTPYHLCHFEVPFTVARVALFGDVAVDSIGPYVDVVSVAKRDLAPGVVLDGIGGYHLYGVCEDCGEVAAGGLLPIGLAEGCVLKHSVPKDELLTYGDVEVPGGRLCDELRAEQDAHFSIYSERKEVMDG